MPATAAAPRGARPLAPWERTVRRWAPHTVLVLVLVVLPLVSVPQALDIREPARRLVITLALALTLVLDSLDRRSDDGPRLRLPHDVRTALLVTLAVVALAALTSGHPLTAVLGRYPRYEGLTMIASYVALVLAGARVAATTEHRGFALRALAATTTWLAIMATRDIVAAGALGRATTPLGNASTVGVWGVMALAVLGHHLRHHRRWWMAVGTLAGFVLVVLSASRGGIVGAAVACLTAAGIAASHRGARWMWPFVAALLALAATVVVYPSTRQRLFGDAPGDEGNVSIRMTMWRETAHLIADRPVLGVGPSQWVSRSPLHRTPEHYEAMLGSYPLDGPHNLVLQVLSVAGGLGLLAVLTLGVLCLRRLAGDPGDPTGDRAHRAGLLTALVAVSGALMFAYTEPVFVAPLLLLLGGALATEEPVHAPRPAPSTPAGVVTRAALACAVVGVLAGNTLALASETKELTAVRTRPVAVGPMSQALRARPWDGDARLRAAWILQYRADHIDGWRTAPSAGYADSACRRLVDDPWCLLREAKGRNNDGRHAEALESADRGLALAPNDPELMRERARALTYLGRFAEAYAQADRLITTFPDLALGYDSRARVQADAGHLVEAGVSMSAADRLREATPQAPAPRW